MIYDTQIFIGKKYIGTASTQYLVNVGKKLYAHGIISRASDIIYQIRTIYYGTP